MDCSKKIIIFKLCKTVVVSNFCLSSIRPHNMEPVVELNRAKDARKELQLGAVGWIALVMCSNAAQANYASANPGAAPKTQTGYISCRKGLIMQDIAA